MPVKVSEKKLILSLLFLAGAIILILNANLYNKPVHISEKGIAFVSAGIMLLAISVRLLRRSFLKA
jgi:hypothetical protein